MPTSTTTSRLLGQITDDLLLKDDLRPNWLTKPTASSERIKQQNFRNPYSIENNKKYEFHKIQETALALLIWNICSSLKTKRHNEAKAERTVAYLIKRADNKRKLQDALGNHSILHRRIRYDEEDEDDDIQLSSSDDDDGQNGSGSFGVVRHQNKEKETSTGIELSDDEVATIANDEHAQPFADDDDDDDEGMELSNRDRDRDIEDDDDVHTANNSIAQQQHLDEDEIEFLTTEENQKKNLNTHQSHHQISIDDIETPSPKMNTKRKEEKKNQNSTSEYEIVLSPTPPKKRSKKFAWQDNNTTSIDEDLAEIEQAIQEQFPPVRCKNLPQPPLIMKSEKEKSDEGVDSDIELSP